MARYDMWLTMQRQLIDNGTAAATIVLEAPDGGRFGTWPIGFASLEESLEAMLRSLTEALPKGRHGCRLVSFDSQGAQLSCLPITVTGAGEAATEAGQGRLAQERSNSITISNAEKQIAAAMTVVDHLVPALQASLAAHERKDQMLEELIEATQQSSRELIRQQGREDRLNAMFKNLEPLVGVAVNFAANFAVDWLEKKGIPLETKETQQTLPATTTPPPPPPERKGLEAASEWPEWSKSTPTPIEVIGSHGRTTEQMLQEDLATNSVSRVAEFPGGQAGPTPSDESPSPCATGSDSQPGESRTDVEGRPEADRRNHPGRDGRPPQGSKPHETTGRRGTLARLPEQRSKGKKKQ